MKKLFAVLIALVLVVSFSSAIAETWTCPNCGREDNDGNFCPTCAEAKPVPKVICSLCGAEYEGNVDYIYCPNCAAPLHQESVQSISFGAVITFGSYEQDNDLSNGPEPIEWIVLDVQDGKVLLLSRYGLEEKLYYTEREDITWEKSTLRVWLNDEFLNNAFSAEEQSAILITDVDNSADQCYSGWDTSGGNNTQDRVFLLSYSEANHYLDAQYWKNRDEDPNLKSRVVPTEYAIQNGAYVSKIYLTTDGTLAGWWWLRSPGSLQQGAARVCDDGLITDQHVNYNGGCVRPALWLNLESGIF